MKKIINLVIEDCLECPYRLYDVYCDKVIDSGYYCRLARRRIIDDHDFYEYKEVKIEIPDWCPLETLKEE